MTKKFDEKHQFIQVKFNTPLSSEVLRNNNITIRSYKFDNQIDISKRANIKELRIKIAESLCLDQNSFVMKKFSHMGQELKNNIETLDKLTNSILTVYVEYGNPMQDSKFNLICRSN